MEEKNNFQRLLEEDEQRYLEIHHAEHRADLSENLRMFRLVGDLFDLFIPNLIDSAAQAVETDPPAPPQARKNGAPPTEPGPDGGPPGPNPPEEPPVR